MCWRGLEGEEEKDQTCGPWCEGGMNEACACGEKADERGMMRAASLLVLDARSSLGGKGAVREAAMRLF